MWGRRGAAIDSDGRVFLGTGDALFDPENRRLGNGIVGVKLDANKRLQLVDFFGAPNANWLFRRDLDVNTTPVAIDYRERKFLIGTSKECKVWLLDRDSLGGEDHRTTLHTTPLICADSQAFDNVGVWGALGAWQDPQGTQWVLVPFWGPVSTKFKAPIEHSRPKGGGVAAFKLEQAGGKWQLTPAWLSRDMDLAEETVIANGIVFACSSGVDGTQVVQDAAWNEPSGPIWRRAVERCGTACSQCTQGHDPRVGRSDRQGALEQRRCHHVVEPLQWHHGDQRPRLYRHMGRDAPRVWCEVAMMNRVQQIVILLAAVLFTGAVAIAQVGRGWSDWPTPYADAQRTSWLRIDPKISVESLSKSGFEMQWTSKLDELGRKSGHLTQGVTASGVTLFVPVSLLAGANSLYMLDNDTGHIIWSRAFEQTLAPATGSCNGGIAAAPTRIVSGIAEPTVPPAACLRPRRPISRVTAVCSVSLAKDRSSLARPDVVARQVLLAQLVVQAARRVAPRVHPFPARRTPSAAASDAPWSATRSPVMVNCTSSVFSRAKTCKSRRRFCLSTRGGQTQSRSEP